jgi:hypothetical protein
VTWRAGVNSGYRKPLPCRTPSPTTTCALVADPKRRSNSMLFGPQAASRAVSVTRSRPGVSAAVGMATLGCGYGVAVAVGVAVLVRTGVPVKIVVLVEIGVLVDVDELVGSRTSAEYASLTVTKARHEVRDYGAVRKMLWTLGRSGQGDLLWSPGWPSIGPRCSNLILRPWRSLSVAR